MLEANRSTAHSSPNASGWGPALSNETQVLPFCCKANKSWLRAICFLSSSQLRKEKHLESQWLAVADRWGKTRLCNSSSKEIQNLSLTNGSQLYVHMSVCKISVTHYTPWVLGYCMPAPHTSSTQIQERQLSCFISFTWNSLLQERILIWNTALAWRVLHCFKHSDKWTWCFSLQEADRAVAALAQVFSAS